MPHWTEISEKHDVVAEIKFLAPFSQVDPIRDWARARLRPDPYGEGPFRDTYRTTSIYFDTPSFDVYQRRGSYGRSKYRIRRYGQLATVFLERKMKKHDLVSKRRSVVELPQLRRLRADEAEPHWPGFWFHRRLLARDLHPVCRIAYRRTALMGDNRYGSIRLTLDDELRMEPAGRFDFDRATGGQPIVDGHAILELKYHDQLPPVFGELIETFNLISQPISKYRLAIGQAGWASEPAMAESDFHVQEV
jgi:hypothetical protein